MTNLYTTLSTPLKAAATFLNVNEGSSGLALGRCVQDTAVNLAPKAVFARSKADLAENSFMEILESILVYFGPGLVGEKIFRKIYSKNLTNEAKDLMGKSTKELFYSKNPAKKAVMAAKAATALSALAIPIAEFSLNYFKNLFTLKVFKQADFVNVVKLDKNKKEDSKTQEKVKNNAFSRLKTALGVYGGVLLASFALFKKGKGSKALQNLSETILLPGSKIFKKGSQGENFFNKYFSLDFTYKNGKMGLSRGQLTSCVLIGGVGYFDSANARGKQNLIEVATRYPLVGLYVITGSELFENGFKAILKRFNKCSEVLKEKDLTMNNIEEYAKKLAKTNNTEVKDEYKKLIKQKAFLHGVPFLFSMLVMGFFVTGCSVLFTKLRYNKEKNTQIPYISPLGKNKTKVNMSF